MKLHTKLTLGLISSLFVASVAMAAGPGSRMSRHHAGMDCTGMSMMSSDMKINTVDRVHKHLAELNTKLVITAEQQPAWDAFSVHVNEQAMKMVAMRDMMKSAPSPMSKTVPDQMAKMAEIMKERSVDMAKMTEVVKTFYAALTPAQQSTFDKMHMRLMARMR